MRVINAWDKQSLRCRRGTAQHRPSPSVVEKTTCLEPWLRYFWKVLRSPFKRKAAWATWTAWRGNQLTPTGGFSMYRCLSHLYASAFKMSSDGDLLKYFSMVNSRSLLIEDCLYFALSFCAARTKFSRQTSPLSFVRVSITKYFFKSPRHRSLSRGRQASFTKRSCTKRTISGRTRTATLSISSANGDCDNLSKFRQHRNAKVQIKLREHTWRRNSAESLHIFHKKKYSTSCSQYRPALPLRINKCSFVMLRRVAARAKDLTSYKRTAPKE